MDNQHKKITGYRDLSQDEIDLMNDIKEVAERVGRLSGRVHNIIEDDIYSATILDSDDQAEVLAAKRWAESGQEDLQVGFMKLIRSIARPTTF